MSLDAIIAQLRELAANATRAAKSPAPCCDGHCPHAYRAETMAARFTELDAAMSNLARLPRAWASPFVPGTRTPR
ncbi:hypothetical protein Caci_6853 [Catenulispora acidiphila DSM 44928]|uniref:Uncharacterized protein n=1 Tax=Catenulispora acidiphila (strain DSM 44928 / JCM 14897 / NBRC 102108 / NRRL B-24433 / ID139908) TaxID=479433 RepID=C7Q1Z2_CATAD|nr:hypothetical protein [Catenulispora acidiphila]ACU75693.1 hypothetical protein Caci_6853 [Catenulispora acidiphila DSM 44928]